MEKGEGEKCHGKRIPGRKKEQYIVLGREISRKWVTEDEIGESKREFRKKES